MGAPTRCCHLVTGAPALIGTSLGVMVLFGFKGWDLGFNVKDLGSLEFLGLGFRV